MARTSFGQCPVRVSCVCGASRHIEPEALARLVGWTVTLKDLAPWLRCSMCGKKAAEVVAVARPRPRGIRRIRAKTPEARLAQVSSTTRLLSGQIARTVTTLTAQGCASAL